MKYSADTSTFIQPWRKYYPIDVFPSFWDMMDSLIGKGDLVAIDEVLVELEKKDDEVLAWVRRRNKVIVPISDSIQYAVREVLTQRPRLVDTRRNRSGADPFVIALALAEGLTVVTDEQPTGSADRPNIPDVREHLGVECVGIIDLIRAEGRRF